MKDTPPRYIYRDIAGLSAKCALGIIASLRKAYPQLREELDCDQQFFERALRQHNEETKLNDILGEIYAVKNKKKSDLDCIFHGTPEEFESFKSKLKSFPFLKTEKP